MKILVYGAGAMGTYIAYKLVNDGHELTLLARGERYHSLSQHSALLEDANSGAEYRHSFPVVESIPREERFDLLLVTVQSQQMEEALDELAGCSATWIVCIGMYVSGMGAWRDQLGAERTLFAFPGTSAVLRGERVVFVEGSDDEEQVWGLTMGSLGGVQLEGTEKLASLFINAGVPVQQHNEMAAVFMSQAAVRLPILAALELAGGNLDLLHDRGDLLKLMVKGIREALAAVRSAGYTPVPSSLAMYRYVPIFVIANAIKHRFSTQASRIGIEAFGQRNWRETAALAAQLLESVRGFDISTEHLDFLFDQYL